MKHRILPCIAFFLFAATLPAQRVTRSTQYDAVPQGFEPNLGQSDSQVRYLAHGRGVSLFLTPSEVVWSLSRREGKGLEAVGATVTMKLLDSNENPEITGVHMLDGRSNYILGKDPSHWHQNVPSCEKVQYRNIYPGIDLVFYRGSEQRLEFDFVVAPGADPNKIQLAFEGAGKIAIDDSGDILLHTAAGEIRTKAPRVYQESNGRKTDLQGRYLQSGANRVSFEVSAYDRTQPLIIDPIV
jgi:hypothetical protein